MTSAATRGWKNLAAYRWYFLSLAALSIAEVGLRVTIPWPMKLGVDHALGTIAPPQWMSAVAGRSRGGWLVFAVVAGVVLQALHQGVLMLHTRVHTHAGHLLTRDLRQRLFMHLQSLTLRHHSQLPVGELAYRLQTDATFLDQLIVRGLLPLVFCAITLIVMVAILLRIDWTLAVVSLTIVPLLFGWIRWSTRRLHPRAERTHARDRIAAVPTTARIVFRDSAREELRARIVRDQPVHEPCRPGDAGTGRSQRTRSMVFAGRRQPADGGNGAGAARGRVWCTGRTADHGTVAGGPRLPRIRLRTVVGHREHNRHDSAGAGERAPRPRRLPDGGRGGRRPSGSRSHGMPYRVRERDVRLRRSAGAARHQLHRTARRYDRARCGGRSRGFAITARRS